MLRVARLTETLKTSLGGGGGGGVSGDQTRCTTGLELEKSKPVTFSVQNDS